MPYRVFLVEDEIVAREGICNTVDWGSVGFEFCGEASDGEMALTRIEACKPDVLITDIRMPFMDGLQLSKIVREHMPWIKIVIISGYDEFEYAQTALKIGVTQYLLKPVSSADILDVLRSLAVTLDQEKAERAHLKQLKSQVAYNLQLRREQLLLRLVMGGVSSGDAIEQGQDLGLALVAPYYLVMVVRIELGDESRPYDYDVSKRVEDAVANLVANSPDVLLTKKGLEELVLILKGEDEEPLQQEGRFWADLIQKQDIGSRVCRLRVETGNVQDRLSDLHRSFTQALVKARSLPQAEPAASVQAGEEPIELPGMDHQELENILRFGDAADLDAVFERPMHAICESAMHSDLVKHYLFLEVFLTTAQFLSDLGYAPRSLPEVREIEERVRRATTLTQIKDELTRVISEALAYRDAQINHERRMIVQRARAMIDELFTDPDLRMNLVAQRFGLSPSHFSTVFSHEIGEPFRDYLNRLRINRAKELLRTTNMKCSEVAHQSGYNDFHYFCTFFKKKTGFTPQQFRRRSQSKGNRSR